MYVQIIVLGIFFTGCTLICENGGTCMNSTSTVGEICNCSAAVDCTGRTCGKSIVTGPTCEKSDNNVRPNNVDTYRK